MKILLVNNCHYRRGGADVVYLNTGALLEEKNHKVIYFSQKNSKNNNSNYEKYFVLPTTFFNSSFIKKVLQIPRFHFSIEAKQKLESIINIDKPDIVHVHLYKGTLTASIFQVFKRHKIPVILTVHDFGLLCPHNLFLDGKKRICERCVKSSPFNCIMHKCNRNNLLLSTVSASEFTFHNYFIPIQRHVSRIICVSKFSYNKHFNSLKYKELFNHMYNFSPEMKKENRTINKGNYFLYYGRLSDEKGIFTLLKAWRISQLKSQLKIVGNGPLIKKIEDFISFHNVKNVQLLGYKDGNTLKTLIEYSSFIIVPSELYENNPMAIVESYGCGKPVIGSRVGGIPEVIIENETGFTFEMGNSINLSEVITMANNLNKSEYASFSNNALNFAKQNFSKEKHYHSLLKIYNDVIIDYSG